MWIERLEIDGFGRLRGAFELASGLNVVVGDNEAGKSTLHDALVRALFGFSDRERRGSASPWRRSRPWDPSRPYRARALVHGARGRSYWIEWDFEAHAVRLLDAATGEDESARVVGKGKAVQLGEYLLGIDLDNFRGVCCLDQTAIIPVQRSDWLAAALQKAVASVAGEAGVEGADGRLRDLVSRLGYRADTYKPTSTGRALRLGRERERLRRELEAARAARDRAQELAAALARARARRSELEEREAEMRGRLLAAELRAAQGRLEEARRLADKARDVPEAVPDGPFAEAAEIRARIDHVEGEVARWEEEAERAARDVAELEERRQGLAARYRALEPDEGIDDSHEAAVREAWAALQALSGQADAPARSSSGRRRSLAWIALVVLTLGLAWLLAKAARALADRIARRAQEAARARQRQELAERLRAELARAGVAGGGDLREACTAYLAACGRRRERVALGRELAEIETEMARRAEPVRALERARASLGELEAELRRLYERAGIPAADLAAAGRALAQLEEAREQALRRKQEAEAAAKALETVLAGEGIADLERRASELARRLSEHDSRYGGAPAEPIEVDRGRRALEDLEGKVRGAVEEEARLRAELEGLEEGLPRVSELEEELSAVEDELRRLELYRDAARLAREALSEAAQEVHRAFAPQLNGALARALPRITGGRYAEALVADDLSLKVRAPETGELVEPERLSRGTQDQIFLVQRLEIARLLDPTTGAAPLLLDDPFAHFDPTRLRLGLELLAEVAQERQVILFSEDPALVDLAGRVYSRVHVVSLAPVEPPQGAPPSPAASSAARREAT